MTSLAFKVRDAAGYYPAVQIAIELAGSVRGRDSAEADLAYIELIAKACRVRLEDLLIELERARHEQVAVVDAAEFLSPDPVGIQMNGLIPSTLKAEMFEAVFQVRRINLPAFTDIRLDGRVVPVGELSARILIPFSEDPGFGERYGVLMAAELLKLVYSYDLAGQDVLASFLRLSGYSSTEDTLLDTLKVFQAPVGLHEYRLHLTFPAGLNLAGEAIVPAFASTFVLDSPSNAPLIRAAQVLGVLYAYRATDINLLQVQLRAAGHRPRPTPPGSEKSSGTQEARSEGDHVQRSPETTEALR